jgi:endonuclease III
MNKQKRHQIFLRFQEENPRPTTELHYASPFELLIAVILSAQATDVRVNLVTATLFPIANTPQAILDLGLEKLKKIIQSIGLYNRKADNILKTSALLVTQHQGQVPSEREALEALPGVARKTANVILNTVFGQATIAVDTHVFRVANRTGLARGKTPLAVELNLLKNIDAEFLHDAHHWLVLHGRYVCTARNPHCRSCLIEDLCEFSEKNMSM